MYEPKVSDGLGETFGILPKICFSSMVLGKLKSYTGYLYFVFAMVLLIFRSPSSIDCMRGSISLVKGPEIMFLLLITPMKLMQKKVYR